MSIRTPRLAGFHGILYPARHNDTRQVASFNRNNSPPGCHGCGKESLQEGKMQVAFRKSVCSRPAVSLTSDGGGLDRL